MKTPNFTEWLADLWRDQEFQHELKAAIDSYESRGSDRATAEADVIQSHWTLEIACCMDSEVTA